MKEIDTMKNINPGAKPNRSSINIEWCFKQIKYTTLENKRSKVLAKNIYGKRKCSNLIEA